MAGSNGGTGGGTAGAAGTSAGPVSLLFSKYVEGTSNNKAVEIKNLGGQPVDLSSCGVRIYANGATTPGTNIALTGTLAAADVVVLCNSNASASVIAVCDLTSSSLTFNGDDAVQLFCASTSLDVIGQIGADPGTEWGSGLTSTADNTLQRHCSVTAGDPDGSDAFDPAVEWTGFALDTITGLGDPTCAP